MFFSPTIIRLLTPHYCNLSGHLHAPNSLSESTLQTNDRVTLAEDRQRLISVIFGASLGAASAIGFSLNWFQLSGWIDWGDAVRTMPDEFILTEVGNHSPTYLLQYSLDLPTWMVMLIPVVLAIVIL